MCSGRGVLTLGILAFGTGLAGLRAARSPRVFGTLVVTALLISVNWGVYVWAIATGHGLDRRRSATTSIR